MYIKRALEETELKTSEVFAVVLTTGPRQGRRDIITGTQTIKKLI